MRSALVIVYGKTFRKSSFASMNTLFSDGASSGLRRENFNQSHRPGARLQAPQTAGYQSGLQVAPKVDFGTHVRVPVTRLHAFTETFSSAFKSGRNIQQSLHEAFQAAGLQHPNADFVHDLDGVPLTEDPDIWVNRLQKKEEDLLLAAVEKRTAASAGIRGIALLSENYPLVDDGYHVVTDPVEIVTVNRLQHKSRKKGIWIVGNSVIRVERYWLTEASDHGTQQVKINWKIEQFRRAARLEQIPSNDGLLGYVFDRAGYYFEESGSVVGYILYRCEIRKGKRPISEATRQYYDKKYGAVRLGVDIIEGVVGLVSGKSEYRAILAAKNITKAVRAGKELGKAIVDEGKAVIGIPHDNRVRNTLDALPTRSEDGVYWIPEDLDP